MTNSNLAIVFFVGGFVGFVIGIFLLCKYIDKMQKIISALTIRKIYYGDKLLSAGFVDKIDAMIKAYSPFFYPERKDTGFYFPKFDYPLLVDTSPIRNYKRAKFRLNLLHQIYDLDGLAFTYDNLCDEYSREKFLMYIIYLIHYEAKIRLPLYYSRDLDNFDKYEKLRVDDTTVETCCWDLKKYDLTTLGYDLKVLCFPLSVMIDFSEEQYKYRNKVLAEEGDFVLDCGACFGDTSLYFANKVGLSGKVFAFEFLKENLEILEMNIELNPKYKDVISVVSKPISDVSGKEMFVIPHGPATKIVSEKIEGAETIKTTTIDDFVHDNQVEKVDFIKMDIEGCELEALKGASATISNFKPKLAICIYHKPKDAWTIPQYIKSLVPEYNLYLDNYTINNEEFVLYAKIKE